MRLADSGDIHRSPIHLATVFIFYCQSALKKKTRRNLQFKTLKRILQQFYIVDRNWFCINSHPKFVHAQETKRYRFSIVFYL